MAVPALIVKVAQSFTKVKLAKDILEILSKKKVDKVDKIISYIPGAPKKALSVMKKYSDIVRESNLKIAKNKSALSNLVANAQRIGGNAQFTRYFKYNEIRFLKNIQTAQKAKDSFIYNEIKKTIKNKVFNLTPVRRLGMSFVDLAKVIYNKESWFKIAQHVGKVLNSMGSNEVSRVLNLVNRVGNMQVTANAYWRHISENKNYRTPLIGQSGACALIKIQQYKDPLTQELFDRKFYFNAFSPETQNFSQEYHSYDCNTHIYEIPMRGWFGKRVQRYQYSNVELNTILNTICRRLDAGHNYWNQYATMEAVVWAQIFGSYYGDKNKK